LSRELGVAVGEGDEGVDEEGQEGAGEAVGEVLDAGRRLPTSEAIKTPVAGSERVVKPVSPPPTPPPTPTPPEPAPQQKQRLKIVFKGNRGW
jgi:hypothetical protein